jgi:hypothetical protein
MKTSLLVAAASLAVALPSSAATATPRHTAKLHVSSSTPLRLKGTGFARHEKVKVLLRANAVYRQIVRTGSKGGFTIEFPSAVPDRCMGYVATARGATGDMAALKVMPLECAPTLGPPTQ